VEVDDMSAVGPMLAVAAAVPLVPEPTACRPTGGAAVGAGLDARLVGAVAGLACTPEDVRAAARLRGRVYVEEKRWLPAAVLVDGGELDADDARAVPLLVRAGDGTAIATFRVLRPAGAPLPVERLAGVTLDPGRRPVECSRLVVDPSWRGGGAVLLALCRLVVSVAQDLGAQDLWALVEQPFLARLQHLGFPFQARTGPVRAYDSDNVAAVMRLEDLPAGLRGHQRRHGCALADWFASPYDGAVRAGGLCGVG
jgi:N-acyl-L-homoserine lactone synthetase